MKRIAIQYSGQMRRILDCFNNHYENLVLQNEEYEVDFFGHFWFEDFEHYKLERILKFINFKDIKFDIPMNFDHIKLEPTESAKNGINILKDPNKNNMISMFYGMEKVNDMRIAYENNNNIKYDYVVRLRSDIYFRPKIRKIDSYSKDFIHAHHGYRISEYGLPDEFFLGPPELMNKLVGVYSNLENLVNKGSEINAESLLGFNAKYCHSLPIKFQQWMPIKFDYVFWHMENSILTKNINSVSYEPNKDK